MNINELMDYYHNVYSGYMGERLIIAEWMLCYRQ